MSRPFYCDIHCHPSIKAYAKSYKFHPGIQSDDPEVESSIWRTDLPSTFDKFKNVTLTLTNFIQSDATSLLRGRVGIVCLSFYPQEKAFFKNKLGKSIFADILTTTVTEFTKPRIDHIQDMTSYWEDFLKEVDFVLQNEGKEFDIDGKKLSYKVARSYHDIQQAIDSGKLGESLVLFVPTIEGLHIFDQVMDSREDWKKYPEGVNPAFMPTLLQRAAQLRAGTGGTLRPSFVTFAHHFWNGLCGHETSLGGVVRIAVDQQNGLGIGFTDAGRAVLAELLDEKQDENGNSIPPVLIDIKHMSMLSRKEYFSILDTKYLNRKIPIVCSHGGVNGLSDPLRKKKNTPAGNEDIFNEDWINLFDDEIVRIAQTEGLFGIQLDERRIGSKEALKEVRKNHKDPLLRKWAKLVWNQVRHIGELLDMHNLDAWNIQCLGADFDGIVDPINGYWTSESMKDLAPNLLPHVQEYMAAPHLTQQRNKDMKPEDIVANVMTENVIRFLSKNY